MSLKYITVVSVLIAITSLTLLAAEKHGSGSSGMSHSSMDGGHSSFPQEGGQAAFSALIEIIDLLERDNNTDWSTVNIDGLREHLRDMNLLVLETSAAAIKHSDNKIQFNVTGDVNSMRSISNMVPAHARFIKQSRGWDIEVTLTDTGAQVIVTSDESRDIDRLKALGFYGFMSLDSHHQAHHVQMARGQSH